MNKLKIIGILGKKGSGKDLVSDYLVEKHNFEKYSLAEPLAKYAPKLDISL